MTVLQPPAPARPGPGSGLLTALAVAIALVAVSLVPAAASAQAPAGVDGYVIEAGREAEVVALFSPLTLPGEITDGWTLANLAIDGSHIVCDLRGPDGRAAEVLLLPQASRRRAALKTTSFAIVAGEGDLAPPDAVVEALHGVVAANDTTQFYNVDVTRLLTTGRNATIVDVRWFVDGLVWSGLVLLLLLVLTIVDLRREPVAIGALVLGAVAVGAALRLTMAENVAMGAWPFSRWHSVTLAIANGPALALLSERFDVSWSRHDLSTTITLAYAIVTPLAIFSHARYLLRDARAGVAATWIIALLPHHIRFSHSEVAFIPSIVLGATLFASSHMALREQSVRLRALAWIALPFISAFTYSARPLNVVFFPLVVWMTFGLDHTGVRLRRKLGVVALTGVGLAYTLLTTFAHYTPNVEEGLSSTVVLQGLIALARQPHLFIPLNFSVTPIAVTALAVFGLFDAWRRGRRRIVLFLFVWFWGFVVLHAYVVPNEVAMQARYYLHMVVPMAFAAGIGIVALAARGPRWAFASAVLLLLASPLLHRGFIKDVRFADTVEYAFAVELADRIPTGCTVLEYVGHLPPPPEEYPDETLLSARARFATERFERGEHSLNAHVISLGALAGEPGLFSREAEAALRNPPECLLYYEGLLCWGLKDAQDPIAPACALMHERSNLELLASRDADSRLLDEAAAPGIQLQDIRMRYGLYAVTPLDIEDAPPATLDADGLPWPLRLLR